MPPASLAPDWRTKQEESSLHDFQSTSGVGACGVDSGATPGGHVENDGNTPPIHPSLHKTSVTTQKWNDCIILLHVYKWWHHWSKASSGGSIRVQTLLFACSSWLNTACCLHINHRSAGVITQSRLVSYPRGFRTEDASWIRGETSLKSRSPVKVS